MERSRRVFILGLVGSMIAISVIGIVWFLGFKAGIENHNYNPILILKDYNPAPEAVSKGTFEKKLSRWWGYFRLVDE